MAGSAYIAASRRSDRSLEARVESARRASEIHKRRTGRSLRVTEQDVVNEEMYEEEDDDLPLQYRRLTAHLQTGSADFNRRLAAYLTNHVAMRSALDQAITNSYAQQYPNAPQFVHNQRTMFPSPLMPHNIANMPTMMQQSQQQQQQQQSMQNNKAPSVQPLSHPYRQSPYPMPARSGYRTHPHNRSMSISTLHEVPGFVQSFPTKSPSAGGSTPESRTTSLEHRSMSLPAASSSPIVSRTPQPLQATSTTAEPSSVTATYGPKFGSPQSMQPPPTPQFPENAYQNLSMSPFSTSLPLESQQLLGNTLDPNDPLTSMFMTATEAFPQSFYNFGGQMGLNKFHPSYDGMSATLAPSALDLTPNYNESSSATSNSGTTPIFNYPFDGNAGDFKGLHYTAPGSGTVTPGIDGGWDAFIDDNSWADSAT